MDEAARPPAPPLGNSALQTQTLESLTSAVNYHRWLTDLARPHLGDHPLELGSGLGDYAETWLTDGVPEITVTEIDPGRAALLQQRFVGRPEVHVRIIDVLDPPPGKHSAFVAFNVLEHIPDDVGALRAAHTLVRPGGAVVMFVPAFQLAMSRFDREVGHVRRYSKRSLRKTMEAAGLAVDDVRYVDMPGLPAWIVGMRLLRMTPGDGAVVRLWDRVVIPSPAGSRPGSGRRSASPSSPSPTSRDGCDHGRHRREPAAGRGRRPSSASPRTSRRRRSSSCRSCCPAWTRRRRSRPAS
jgi:SAM-dependent methyltransferase